MSEFDQKSNEALEAWYARVNNMDRRQMTQADLNLRAETLVHITALKKASRSRSRRR